MICISNYFRLIDNQNLKGVKIDKKVIDFTLITLFAISAFMASYYRIQVFSTVVLVLCLYSFFNKNLLISMLLGVSIFTSFFSCQFGTYTDTINRLLSVLMVLRGILDIFWRKNSKRRFHYVAVLVLLAIGMPMFLLKMPLENYISFWVLNIFVFFALINIDFDKKAVFNYLVIFSLVIVPLLLYHALVNPYIDNIYEQRVSIAEGINQNRLGMAAALYAVIMFLHVIREKDIFKKALLYSTIVASLYIIVLSGSRNSLLAIVASLFIIEFTLIGGKKNFLKHFISIIFFMLTIMILFYTLSNSPVIKRYTLDAVLANNASFRFNSWPIMLFKIFPKHLLFGIGIGNQEVALLSHGYVSKIYNPAHNILISALVELGLIGFAVFLWVVFHSYNNITRICKEDEDAIPFRFILCAILFLGIGETIYYERMLWILLGISYGMVALKQKV